MIIQSYIKKFISNNSFQKVLIYGFYITFIGVNIIAMIVDSISGSYTSLKVETLTVFVSSLVFLYTHKTQNLTFGTYGVWVGPIALYVLIIFSDFVYWNFYFTLLIPLAFYTLFPFRSSFIQTGIHFLIVIILMIIGYHTTENNFLHNVDSLSAFVISIIFMVAFGIFYHANLENSYNKLYKSNQQKEILLKEVHHRVKNNLNILGSIFGLQAMREQEHTKDILLQNKLKIESMSMVHEMLYKHNDFSNIDFYQYTKTLSSHMIDLFEKKDTNVIIDLNKVEFPLEIMLKIGLMLNEMLTNSMKYAKNDTSLTIEISCKQNDKEYTLIYRDNGKNKLDVQELQNSKGIGIKLINLTSKELDGELSIDYKNGLQYKLNFRDGLQLCIA